MRLPPKPDGLENPSGGNEPINGDPSYPDRARIDSDVRAFLRPASSPWIVFDRDSRCDDFAKTALRVGAVFASSPSIMEKDGVVTSASALPVQMPVEVQMPAPVVTALPMFPPSAPETPLEPSNVVVAKDVLAEPATEHRAPISSLVELPPGMVRSRKRVAWIAAASSAGVVLAAVLAIGLHPGKRSRHAVQANVQAPVLDAQPAPPPPVQVVEPVSALAEQQPAAPATTLELDNGPAAVAPHASASSPETRLLGKLTIKADGKVRNVWFDGKRMLGTGTRSFLVACGMHTIAINDKHENKDIEIPCNGEFVVSK
jgi:hypothetical protein